MIRLKLFPPKIFIESFFVFFYKPTKNIRYLIWLTRKLVINNGGQNNEFGKNWDSYNFWFVTRIMTIIKWVITGNLTVNSGLAFVPNICYSVRQKVRFDRTLSWLWFDSHIVTSNWARRIGTTFEKIWDKFESFALTHLN